MNWSMTALSQVTEKIGSGVTPRGGDSNYVDSGTALIRSQNIYNMEFKDDGLVFIGDEIAEKMKGVAVEDKDVLLNITGDSVARCCIIDESFLPARVNQHVAIIRTNKKALNPYFLMYYMTSPYMQRTLLSWAGNGGTRKALTKGMLEGFHVPTPSLDQQDSIVDVLNQYSSLIENNNRRIQLLEESARLLYQEWFVHLRFPGHEHVEIVDGVPESWEATNLPEVIQVNPRTRVDKGKEITYVSMSALSETDMTADASKFERRTKHTNVKFIRDDVLLARITPCLENGKTGFAYFLDEDEIACGSTEFIVLRAKKVSPIFTYCLSRSYPFRENAIKSMTGSSGRQRVQVGCFDEYKVPLPPLRLLEQFDEAAGDSFKQIAVLMQQTDRLKKARDLLLPRLMNGEISV